MTIIMLKICNSKCHPSNKIYTNKPKSPNHNNNYPKAKYR